MSPLNPDRPEAMPDQLDQASAQAAQDTEAAVIRQQAKAKALASRWAPREDGLCACGCGEEVDPRRIAMGLGLYIDCAERLGPQRP